MIALIEKCIKKYFFISCPLNVVYFNFNRQFSPTHFLQNASRNGGMQQLYSDSLIFEVFPSLLWLQLNLNLWCFSYSSFVTIQKSTKLFILVSTICWTAFLIATKVFGPSFWGSTLICTVLVSNSGNKIRRHPRHFWIV